ncbi:MAG TPA: hypothetical protein PK402_04475, partial [Tepidisphaeraceae bacterium]|nr:hypothetical protein [Tepidisphaeraceae bacterium]
IYLLALIYNNWSERARFWYWPGTATNEVSITRLMLVAFVGGLIIGATGLATMRAVIQYRRTRNDRLERRKNEINLEMNRKASMLRTKPNVSEPIPPNQPIN